MEEINCYKLSYFPTKQNSDQLGKIKQVDVIIYAKNIEEVKLIAMTAPYFFDQNLTFTMQRMATGYMARIEKGS